jgi:hypothetical protein
MTVAPTETTLTTNAPGRTISAAKNPVEFERVAGSTHANGALVTRSTTLAEVAKIATDPDPGLDWDLLARIGEDDWEPKPTEA